MNDSIQFKTNNDNPSLNPLEALCMFKMEDISYKCPLCCSKAFSSKELLIDHLNNIIQNLHCPICNNNVPSLIHLIEHLKQENCLIGGTVELETSEQINQIRSIILEKTSQDNHEIGLNKTNMLEFKNGTLNTSSSSPIQTIEAVNMFEIMKSRGTQDVQFLKDSEGQYMIITENADAIVTKQNNDGTISLTSVTEMKMESESQSSPEPDPEVIEEEMYSCNTCGVSFSSVIEHIQNYHNDQDVVVEEPADPLADEQEPVKPGRLMSRRIITETGDIVETPFKNNQDADEDYSILPDSNHKEKPAGPGSKRYMRMNNLCDSVVRNLKQNDKSQGPSHKVLVKEVLTKEGELIKYYHCVFCNINVSSLSDFKTQPCKTSKYSCTQCPVTYDNAKSLCAHMKVHKVKSTESIGKATTETFECEVCCTVFPTNKSLKLHKRMHDPIRARLIEAPRNSDFSEMRYLCTTCEKMIPVDYREIHENSHATEQNLLNCGICNKKFSSEEYLEMHMNVHNLDKAPPTKQDQSLPYNCVYCDRRFARPHEKVKHERIHTGEKPHCCEICGKSFRVSYCLTLHMRTHTGARPYACEHCGKRFKAHSVYNHHLLTHSEVRAYKCPYCPKAFKTSVQLAGHKNSHTKPFSCTHCNRPFASLYAVRVHTETHARTNNLKFSCSMCGASYARAFALRDHMKQHHKEEPVDEDVKTKPVANKEWVTVESSPDIDIKTSMAALDKEIAANKEWVTAESSPDIEIKTSMAALDKEIAMQLS